jgi:hypothetical protein
LEDNSGEISTFHEAYNHPVHDTRVWWGETICKEFMNNKGVWEVIPNVKVKKEEEF